MLVKQLQLDTRSKLYTATKKVLRKYQKGIISGKLTSEKFVKNMLADESIISLLDDDLIEEDEFKDSYKSYVEKLIEIQNENLVKSKKSRNKKQPERANVSLMHELKQLLGKSEYELTIPTKYLSNEDMSFLVYYLTTGEIELGNERIYNYLCKK